MLKKVTDEFNIRQNNQNEKAEEYQVKMLEQIAANEVIIRDLECGNKIESSRLQLQINGLLSEKQMQD
jgi:hypothetical protein